MSLPDGAGLALKVEDGRIRAPYAAAGTVLGIPELADRPVHSSRGDLVERHGAAVKISSTTFPQAL